jgi:hypothetical protein
MRSTLRMVRSAAALMACAVLAACALTTADTVTTYYSRILEYYPYSTSGTVSSNSVLNLVYRSTGTLAGKFAMEYDGTTKKATRTDIWSYDQSGTETYNGYSLYAYTGGNITSGKTYNAAGTLVQQYDVTYDTEFTGRQTDRVDYVFDSAGTPTKTAEEVWALQKETLHPARGQYRTDQIFIFDSTGTTKSLTQEYAYWYALDADGIPIEDYELYHVRKVDSGTTVIVLPTGKDEAYYYRSYSYGPEGKIFLEADYWYGDSTTTSKLPTDFTPGSYSEYPLTITATTDPFNYPINLDFICDQTQTIVYAYDEYQNCIKRSIYSYGVLQEVDVYRYEDKSHLAEESRYVDGGATLEQRDVIRYYDITLDDNVTYQVKETTTYYYGTSSSTTDSTATSSVMRGPRSSRVALPEFSPTASSGEELVAAYADRLYRKMRNINE